MRSIWVVSFLSHDSCKQCINFIIIFKFISHSSFVICLHPSMEKRGHSVCQSSHLRLLKSTSKVCPCCRQTLEEAAVQFLTNTGRWHSWKMYSLHLLRDHRDSFEPAVYPEINIGCLNSGCNEPVKRKDAANHGDVCPKEVIPCNQFHKDMCREAL